MQFKNVQLVYYFDSINEAVEPGFVFWLYQYIYYRFIVNEQPLLVCNEGIGGRGFSTHRGIFEPNSFQIFKSYTKFGHHYPRTHRNSKGLIISKTAWENWICLVSANIWKKNVTVLSALFQFGWMLAHQSYRFKFIMQFCFFWDPCHIWGFMDIGMNIIFVKSASVQY